MSIASAASEMSQSGRLPRAQADVLDWYRENARDLPWRRSRDPYAILVSEIMLQQTQVERVIPKFLEFLARFPSLESLAAAPLSEVLRAWAPLGYNRRARHLHLAARQTVAQFEGTLPADVALLRSLPGIGRYTAAAIACFAYDVPAATVDTNIRRVLSRLVLGKHAPASASEAWRTAVRALPADHASAWSQALMDLGATVCLSAAPRCGACPASRACAWYLDGTPTTASAPAVRERPASYIAQGDRGAVRRRARGQIVQALREIDPGAWLAWTEVRRRIQDRVTGHETLDVDDLLERLMADGLVQDRSLDGTRQIALAD